MFLFFLTEVYQLFSLVLFALVVVFDPKILCFTIEELDFQICYSIEDFTASKVYASNMNHQVFFAEIMGVAEIRYPSFFSGVAYGKEITLLDDFGRNGQVSRNGE